jgi:alpha-1,2-mannosyltransferase
MPPMSWAPSTTTFFSLALVVRLLAARYAVLDDCDEVYNYWEPLHLLLYGTGVGLRRAGCLC